MPTAARTTATTPESIARDRAAVLRLPTLQRRLDVALSALHAACHDTPADQARARFTAVTQAYDELVAATEAGYRVAVGPTAGHARASVVRAREGVEPGRWQRETQRLRTERQRHLMRPCLVVREPVTLTAPSYQAFGPRIAGMVS
ncbi:hypothetical protein [Angustibacter sp. Root456]|uniref:hypothetical protein n=1 Tax=Angustibacter sp. Root456 TaxID=1736539 RepID=UPI0006FEE48E|nr:hypothetical protein [Angustibacter sp. Root456]KQX61621.1 hypothetical protein ASD06_13485 [Angustibacter sp. Root456]